MGKDRDMVSTRSARCVAGIWLALACLVLPIATPRAQTVPDPIPLIPGGGAGWETALDAAFAVDPFRNRAFAVGGEESGRSLLQFDAVTGARVAVTPVSATPGLTVLDLAVASRSERVLVAWGALSAGQERQYPAALEIFSASTGQSLDRQPAARFQAFDIDAASDTLWGLAVDPAETHYQVARFDAVTGDYAAASLDLAVDAAIVRDVLLEPGAATLLVLYQPTAPGNPLAAADGAIVARFAVPEGTRLVEGAIAAGAFQPGGLAADDARGFVYLQSHQGESLLHVLDAATLVEREAFAPADVFPLYEPSGSLAVLPENGDLILGNRLPVPADRRVLRVRVSPGSAGVVRLWPAGVSPARLVHDPRLDRVFALSGLSKRLSVIDPGSEGAAAQVATALTPHDLVHSASTDELLLLTGEGDLYAVSLRDGRVSDRLTDTGLLPRAGLALDPPRRRLFAGTWGDAPAAIYDLAALAPQGTLERGGGVLALEPGSDLIVQAAAAGSPVLHLYQASSAAFLRSVTDVANFDGARFLALDAARRICYGAGHNRMGLLRLWAYDWEGDRTIPLDIPPALTPARPQQLQVDPAAGRVYAIVQAGLDPYLLIYDGPGDADPEVLPLNGVTDVLDAVVDPVRGSLILLAEDGFAGLRRLLWVDLAKPGTVESVPLAPAAELLALDTRRGVLWAAVADPPELVAVPRPDVKPGDKADASDLSVALEANPVTGGIRLRWSVDGIDPAAGRTVIVRRDGELTGFRPLLPAPLPAGVTEYVDPDVIPGGDYRYRVTVYADPPLESAMTPPVQAGPLTRDAVMGRPLASVVRLPRGGEGDLAVALEGRINPFQRIAPVAGRAHDLAGAGVSVEVFPDAVHPPGVFSVRIRASTSAELGMIAIPIHLNTGAEPRTLWLFADVVAPLVPETGPRLVLPAGSRTVQIHTDATLREGPGYRLVLKGVIGRGGESGGEPGGVGPEGLTSVIVRIRTPEGGEIEQRGIPVSGGLFATSLLLPSGLREGDVLRARVTWPGSRWSAGGVSPILRLPVGGPAREGAAREGAGKSAELSLPEPAFLIVGATPRHAHFAPGAGDLEAMLAGAESVMVSDYDASLPRVLKTGGEIGGAVLDSPSPSFAFFYLLGDTATVPGALRFPDGSLFRSGDLAHLAGSLPHTTVLAVVEGPESGAFLDAPYPPGMTVITSTQSADNIMRPSHRSFSSGFFEGIQLLYTVEQSKSHGDRRVFDASLLSGLRQQAGYLRGSASDEAIRGRFAPGRLPDRMAPDVLEVTVEETGGAFRVAVRASDDRDAPDRLRVMADVSAPFGAEREVLLAAGGGIHAATLERGDPPGFLLRVTARDQAHNVSAPVVVWVGTAFNALDLNGDGAVDQGDLVRWTAIRGAPFEDWPFALTTEWGLRDE